MKKVFWWLLFFFIIFSLLFFLFKIFHKDNLDKITFLDVGQGNGILIQTKSGKNILIDTGNEKIANQSLSEELGFFDRDLDVIFISHYDLDHIGFLPYYLKNYKVGLLFDSGFMPKKDDSQRAIYDEIEKILKEKKIKKISLKSGDNFNMDDNLKIRVLFPGRFLDVNKLKSNSSSMVLQLFFHNKKILLTGDLPEKFEKFLIKKYGSELKSDILLAGHHGSRSSSSEEFLKVVQPEYLIISVGKDNSYGHPDNEVLKSVQNLGIKILRTDIDGNIEFFF